jgi:hypothetical protein
MKHFTFICADNYFFKKYTDLLHIKYGDFIKNDY